MASFAVELPAWLVLSPSLIRFLHLRRPPHIPHRQDPYEPQADNPPDEFDFFRLAALVLPEDPPLSNGFPRYKNFV